MALPTGSTSSWMQGIDLPSRIFGDAGSTDYELYEGDEAFVVEEDVEDLAEAENDAALHGETAGDEGTAARDGA